METIKGYVEHIVYRNEDNGYTAVSYTHLRGTFRVHGDVVEVIPANEADMAVRIEFFGDEIDRITKVDVLTGEIKSELSHVAIFPASHYVVGKEDLERAVKAIEKELEEQIKYFKSEGKLLEAQRISERTNFDIEMMRDCLLYTSMK